MYEVKLNEKAYKQLEKFIVKYRNVFENLYSQTGLENLNEIVDLYYKSAISLKNGFLSWIEVALSKDIIACKENNTTIVFYKNYKLKVKYNEKWNIRIVANIEISYK